MSPNPECTQKDISFLQMFLPFQINEAPLHVLKSIKKESQRRRLWCLFGIICCPFVPIACCLSCEEDEDEYNACCLPKDRSKEEKAILDALILSLNNLIFDTDKIPIQSNSELDTVIEIQIQNTINLLDYIVSQDALKRGYGRVIKESLAGIKTRHQTYLILKSLTQHATITGYDAL